MNPVEQIAEVLKAHAWINTTQSRHVGHCLCGEYVGRRRGQNPDHDEHVAGAVVEALGLTEEWGVK